MAEHSQIFPGEIWVAAIPEENLETYCDVVDERQQISTDFLKVLSSSAKRDSLPKADISLIDWLW